MGRPFIGRDAVRDRQRSVHEGDFNTDQDHTFVFTDGSEAAQLAQEAIEKQRQVHFDEPQHKQLVGTPTEFKDTLVQFGFQLASEQLASDEVTALAQLISPLRRRTSASSSFPFSPLPSCVAIDVLPARSAMGQALC